MTGLNYSDLIAWQKGMTLAESVYTTTKALPRDERYGLTSQMRRAALSVPANIAEGQGRRKVGQFLHSLSISYGSLRELETRILLASRLGLIAGSQSAILMEQCGEVGRLLNGLMRSLDARR
jgi:four helix bundle protein